MIFGFFFAGMQQQVQKAMAKKKAFEKQQEIIVENRITNRVEKPTTNTENCRQTKKKLLNFLTNVLMTKFK